MKARQVYAAVVVFVTLLVAAIGNWTYIQHVDQQAERRNVERLREICGIIVLIDDRNQSITPANEDQRRFIDELHRYRVRLGCR